MLTEQPGPFTDLSSNPQGSDVWDISWNYNNIEPFNNCVGLANKDVSRNRFLPYIESIHIQCLSGDEWVNNNDIVIDQTESYREYTNTNISGGYSPGENIRNIVILKYIFHYKYASLYIR